MEFEHCPQCGRLRAHKRPCPACGSEAKARPSQAAPSSPWTLTSRGPQVATIVLLALIALYWLYVAGWQLWAAFSNGVGSHIGLLAVGAWNLFWCGMQVFFVRDVVARGPGAIRLLRRFSVSGGVWALLLILWLRAYFMVLVLPLYIMVGVVTWIYARRVEKAKEAKSAPVVLARPRAASSAASWDGPLGPVPGAILPAVTVKPAAFCVRCGSPAIVGAAFCHACGSEILAPTGAALS